MSLGSLLTSITGAVVTPLAPQTGPALASAVTTLTSGDAANLGHSVDTIINAAGADTASSTILHGVAHTVTDLSGTGISNVLAPITAVLASPISNVAGALQEPVSLLVPHTGPTVTTLLTAVGSGSVSAMGHALDAVINGAGADTAQSTILHGVAGILTTVAASSDTFHFASTSSAGTDALSGILSSVSNVATHGADTSAALSSTHADVSHVDIPLHNPLADLAHAVHHA